MPLLLSGLRLVLRKVMGQLRTAQCARTYSFQSRILPTGYKDSTSGSGTTYGFLGGTAPDSPSNKKRKNTDVGAPGVSRVREKIQVLDKNDFRPSMRNRLRGTRHTSRKSGVTHCPTPAKIPCPHRPLYQSSNHSGRIPIPIAPFLPFFRRAGRSR